MNEGGQIYMELLSLKNISKTYGKNRKVFALKDFNLQVANGEMVAIMGKSGSGKSTVLNIISGIDRLEKGSYIFNGIDMSKISGDKITLFRRDNLGFVLQHFALIEDYTIYDNISLPLRLKKESKSEIRKRVIKIAKDLDIDRHLNKYPKELSGGEAQRVAIARAIINNPKLILADEPTGALDEENGERIMEIFKKLHKKGNTLIIVTHDPIVAKMCQRTVRIKDGVNLNEGEV